MKQQILTSKSMAVMVMIILTFLDCKWQVIAPYLYGVVLATTLSSVQMA
ncbi:hypothetical protein [Fibrobacter sp. UWS1]|nr:hypothetical protein [Fibrobacter sp. UWS1]